MALVLGGCGARTELGAPQSNAGYKVLFSNNGGPQPDQVILSYWHSKTGSVSDIGNYFVDMIALTFDGRFMAVELCAPSSLGSCDPTELDVIGPDGAVAWTFAEPMTAHHAWFWLGAIRPDGQRAVVQSVGDETGSNKSDLLVVDAGGTPSAILPTSDCDGFRRASYAPDGHTLVVIHDSICSGPVAEETIETMRDDGTARSVLAGPVGVDGGYLEDPTFSFDGSAVVFVHCNIQHCDVESFDLTTHEVRTVVPDAGPMAAPHFTPDGAAIVFRDVDTSTHSETLRRIDLGTGASSALWQGSWGQAPGLAVGLDQ